MASKKKALTISISADQIVGSEIMKSGDYRYASVGAKVADKEYVRITYEWKGDNVPEFVLGLTQYITSSENKELVDESKEKYSEEYEEFKKRLVGVDKK